MVCVMIHGVPETPSLWDGLIEQLDPPKDQVIAPALPGFIAPPPAGFSATKEAYVDWLIALLEDECTRTGPVDLIGHDWGAILCLRAAHLRPELIKSWAALNAVVLPGARWHKAARLWQTPVAGEVSMLCARPWVMRRMLRAKGMPDGLSDVLPRQITRHMKRAILSLYRSAVDVDDEWGQEFSNLPERGLVLWGARDPFMSSGKAKQFCKTWNVPLVIEKELGHWALCEDPRSTAQHLRQHWDQA